VSDAPTPHPDAPVPPTPPQASDPAPPAPPYAASPPSHTAPSYPAPPSYPGSPSYPSAPGYASAPPAPPVVPPYARGYAQQPYPGAPPVWTTPPPRASGSKVLAAIALGLAIFGGLISLIPFGIAVSWLFLLAAIVLAIIALVRRAGGRGMSIAALIVSGAGVLVSILWGVGFALFGQWVGSTVDSDYDDPYVEDSASIVLGVEAGTGGTSKDDALAFGETVIITDVTTGDPIWEMTVGTPEDVTSIAPDTPPTNGAYLAVPVEITNLTDRTIAVADDYQYTPYPWMMTADGGRLDAAYIPGSYENYPQVWDLDDIAPGETATYYEGFDAAPSAADTAYVVMDLDEGVQLYWSAVSAQ